MINKEVQKLAESTIYSYHDVLFLYDHYKDIEMVKYILNCLRIKGLSASYIIQRLVKGEDPFGEFTFL